MKRMISFGKGFQFVGDTSQDPAPDVGELPKLPQPVRRIKSERMSQFRPLKEEGNGYRPGPLMRLAPDQCKYTVHGTTMCGAKVTDLAWCAQHLGIVYPGKFRFLEAAE